MTEVRYTRPTFRGAIFGRMHRDFFAFPKPSRWPLVPTHPPIQRALEAVYPKLKRPMCESNHLIST